ncbi:EGF-like domain protein [Trichuris suis]|nr:EGF-like domain protein [Trichuris suis]
MAPKCLNGGERTMKGKCRCPKYFSGDDCGVVQCINGGSLSAVNKTVCICSDSHYRGSHCEIVQCENGGIENGYGGCDCLTNWYTGKFCQFYSSSWSILFGCLGLLLLLALVYIACRWYCSFFNNHNNRSRCDRVTALSIRPEDTSSTFRGVDVSGSIPPLFFRTGKPFGRSRTPNTERNYPPASAKSYAPESPPPTYEEVTRMSLLLEHRGATSSTSPHCPAPSGLQCHQ